MAFRSRRTPAPRRQMVWARFFDTGIGSDAVGANALDQFLSDAMAVPPGTTVTRIRGRMTFQLAATSQGRSYHWGFKRVDQVGVLLPPAATFGPFLAQHTDWLVWDTLPLGSGNNGLSNPVVIDFDVHGQRKLPEVENTLAFYFQANAGLAADSWAISASILLKLP